MKQVGTIIACILLVVFVQAQTTPTLRADVNKEAEEEIRTLEFFLASLLEKGDLQTYAGYLADDYLRISQNGLRATKEQVLETMRNKPGAGTMTMKPYGLAVRVYGNMAILNGFLDIERKEGGTITTTSSVFTKVFIRKDDRWYLANMQGTAVAK